MEEFPPVLAPTSEPPPPPSTSLMARLLNVFAMPGRVFEEVKAARRPHLLNWMLPFVLCALMGAMAAQLRLAEPAIQKQFKQILQTQVKSLDQSVASGKISRAEADKVLPLYEKLSLVVVTGAFAMAGGLRIFWWAFLLWLLGRLILKTRFSYSKSLEIAGLAFLISVLGDMVSLALAVDTTQLFSAAKPTLALVDLEALQNSRVLMGVINVFTFWFVGVMSAGLARLAGVPFFRAAWLVCACWMLQASLLFLLGLGQLAM